jgi:hypothetical protein
LLFPPGSASFQRVGLNTCTAQHGAASC